MLTNSPNDSSDAGSSSRGENQRAFVKVLVIVFMGTILGSILGLLLGIAHGSDELTSSAIVGSIFGTGLGVIVGVSFASIRKLRELCTRSKMRTILVFAGLAALAGALILVPFSEGAAMALYLAVEGAIAGSLLGALLGFLVSRLWQK